jgi:hypothetical protein
MAIGKSRHICIAEKLGLASIEDSARFSQHRSQRRAVSMKLGLGSIGDCIESDGGTSSSLA